MIYLIGGVPRVGKTTVAYKIMAEKGIPFVPADVLTHALDNTYKQLGIRAGEWETIPERFFPYLREFVRMTSFNVVDYAIEGDSFFPEHVSRLQKEYDIRSVFLGTSQTSLKKIRGFALHDDWVANLPEEEQQALPAWLMSTSEIFKNESEKYGISYFDMAENREQQFGQIVAKLFE
jgi:hypothetical protein